jgi:hypothetical protein
VVRWIAIAIGCLTALGLSVAIGALARQVALPAPGLVHFAVEALALALAGYVTGHLAGRWQIWNATLAASLYILVLAAGTTVREVSDARAAGLSGLPPIDYLGLALNDLVALLAASAGGGLAGRFAPPSAYQDRAE